MNMNYQGMMKQAKILQKKMKEMQEEISNMEFESSAGGGAVKIKVNGDQEIKEVKINSEMIDADDLDMLEDMIMVATNDAINKSKEEANKKMSSLTGGLNMPGMF